MDDRDYFWYKDTMSSRPVLSRREESELSEIVYQRNVLESSSISKRDSQSLVKQHFQLGLGTCPGRSFTAHGWTGYTSKQNLVFTTSGGRLVPCSKIFHTHPKSFGSKT